MKNKKLLSLILAFIIILFQNNFVNTEEFNFETSQIDILENGSVIKGSQGTKITTKEIEILADKFEYNKESFILKAKGNIIINDLKNNVIFQTNSLLYNKKIEKIFFKEFIEASIENRIFVESNNLTYNRNTSDIVSNEQTEIKDDSNNFFSIKEFVFNLDQNLLKGKNIKFIDNYKNNYYLDSGIIKFKTGEILGKDVSIDFENSLLGNKENEPRLKANAIETNNEILKVSKGIFTSCKKRDGCPPWTIAANEIKHNKPKKTIHYKNAWLKIYDIPILYFPKFYHPDPTVKRQSGFLIPTFSDSKNLGTSVTIPYYKVLAENKDVTIKPRLFSNQEILLQTEYRHVLKNSKHIVDGSFSDKNTFKASKTENIKSHFFTNSMINLDWENYSNSNLEVNIESVSDDLYLKKYKLSSPLIKNESLLNSYIKVNAYNEDISFDTSVEVYEDLNKSESDRYEYIYPRYNFSKNINSNLDSRGDLSFSSSGYQKNYDTNSHDAIIINDLLFNSNENINNSGYKSRYNFIFKNVNTNGRNSNEFKENTSNDLLASFMYETSYPLKKEYNDSKSFLTPSIAFRYSPNKTKDISGKNVRTDINNINTFNRIGLDKTVEGGESITIGGNFSKLDEFNQEYLSLNLARNYRLEENPDLPSTSSLGKKVSHIVGDLNLKPNKYLEFEYNFSKDDNLKKSKYDLIKAEVNVNNFVTSFEYLEENEEIGTKSYIGLKTSYSLDENHSLNFSTRKNKETDLTEFYNLIYQYKNDCLIAAIEYNKSYYSDQDIEPEEQLLFSITVIPFGKANTPSIY